MMKKHNFLAIRIICIAVAVLVAVGAGAISVKNAAAKKAVEGAVTVTGTSQGVFGDDVVVQVTLDASKIYDVTVLEQNETPELGGKACETLPAQIVEANSIAIDGYSGATMTSNAIKDAVSQAIQSAGFNPANFGGEDSGSVTVQATEAGKIGDIVVEVTLDANKIYSVNILEQNETPEIGGAACETFPAQIVEANSVEIDGVSGATVTCDAIKAAVVDCINEAGFDVANFSGDGSASVAEESAESASADSATVTTDENGHTVVSATEKGVFGGDVVVQVTLDENTIYDVTVLEENETPELGGQACATLPGEIVAANSIAVDDYSGATMTSTAIKNAVIDCIEAAGFDPANFGGESSASAAEQPASEESAAPAADENGKVTVQATEKGIGGDVVVEVTLDATTIYDVTVVSQNETPALGGKACETLPGEIVAANSVDVDGYSGATVTSTALKNAVIDCIEEAGFDPANYNGPVAAAAEEAAASGDDSGKVTVQASEKGIGGDVVVEVTLDATTIYDVTVVSQNETPALGGVACEQMPAKFVEANSVDIDGVSGATVTSTALKNAVIDCIEEAGFDPANYNGPVAAASESAAAPAADENGKVTVQASAEGYNGDVTVEVTMDASTIYSITVVSQNENWMWCNVACNRLPGKMVSANSVAVDGVTGATVTGTAIKNAVIECIKTAGFDPANFGA